MNLGQRFRSDVVCVDRAETLADAAHRMREHKVGTVIVLEKKRVVGILTDRDIAMAVVLDGVHPTNSVSHVMAGEVVTIRDTEGIFNATQFMRCYHLRRLPIVNADNEVVGIVTLDDLLSLFGKEIGNLSDAVAPVVGEKGLPPRSAKKAKARASDSARAKET